MISDFAPMVVAGGPVASAAAAYQVARSYGVGVRYWRTDDGDVRSNIRRAARIQKHWERTMRHHKLHVVDDVPTFGERLSGHHKSPKPRYLVPKVRDVVADPYGVTVTVEAIDNIGVDEFRKQAKHLSDAWKFRDLQIEDLVDVRPGFFKLTLLYNDPMTIPEEMAIPDRLGAELPEDQQRKALHHMPLGRGQDASQVWLQLKENNSTTVFGASGWGKTNFLQYWACRLAPSPQVQLVGANGKAFRSSLGDFRSIAPRFSYITGGDPWEVNQLLRGLKAEMLDRLNYMYERYGKDQFWQVGPRVEMPYITAFMDECQEYLTTDIKGVDETSKALIAIIAENVDLSKELQKMGRAAGITMVWTTQKGTGDAIPTAIRDIAAHAISFASRGRAMEVAALGEEISEFPDMSTRKLLKEQYKGVGTIKSDGASGMVRFKVPLIDTDMADALCRSTARYVRRIPGLEEVGCYASGEVPDSPAVLFSKPSEESPRAPDQESSKASRPPRSPKRAPHVGRRGRLGHRRTGGGDAGA